MADSEKKDGQAPDTAPVAPEGKEIADESLESVAGGMGAAVPQVNHASLLKGLAEPCCLSQS